MSWKIPRLAWVAVPLACVQYLYHLGAVGMLGPDEPRYAAIGREMARSGDWITPRLWGEPWFEKPALLYWMSGSAFRLGFGDDLAPRLPVAFLALAFLFFYWWILNREFGGRAAWLATLILGTCAAWWGVSQVGVTDLPVAATFATAMLLALPWIARGDQRFLPVASALLGFAVLAKSLPPVALAAPLVLGWRWWRDLLRPRVILPFLVVALPWHILCYIRNGSAFVDTLFWQHQVGRFVSGALMHGRPWWFYLPTLLGLLLPWTPLLVLAGRRASYDDPRRRFLLAWFLFGLLLFSLAVNKLPGYLLPMMPAAAALVGVALDEAARARAVLTICALLLVIFPLAIPMLPTVLAAGLSRAPGPDFRWTWLLPLGAAALVWVLESRARRLAAVFTIAAGAVAGTVYLKTAAAPEVDRQASARTLWHEIAPIASDVCVDDIRRDWRYGLNYYSIDPLPECAQQARPLHVVQTPGGPAKVAVWTAAARTVDPHYRRIVPSR